MMVSRRSVIAGAGLTLAAVAAPGRLLAETGTLRVAAVQFGSLGWLLATIRAEGLDKKHALKLDIKDVASNQAGPVALLAGEADIIVSDWTWALRQRSLGEPLKFSPYSSALGAVVVPNESKVKTIGDLAGKRVGVAGSAIDKSWLLLRAYSKKTVGKDIAQMATPVFGSAPLITAELRNGRIDAGLNFWTYSARLVGEGYTELLSVKDVIKDLDIDPVPPLVGFVWKETTAATKGREIEAFLAAAAEANAVLAKSDEAWERLRPLVKAASDGEFAAIKASYRSGITQPWSAAETRSAEKLTKLLIELGDTELIGHGTRFDAQLFHVAGG
jgi:NitT/TauT family transport system substrate-binding protein